MPPRSHGRSRNDPTYKSWNAMKTRCLNNRNTNYPRYGGRGITICERWLVFENFLADMGERPVGKTLERKDNSLGYFPDNCTWGTAKQQQNNTRRNAIVEYQGEKLTIAQWGERQGMDANTLLYRLRRGWPVEKAMTRVVDKTIRERRIPHEGAL